MQTVQEHAARYQVSDKALWRHYSQREDTAQALAEVLTDIAWQNNGAISPANEAAARRFARDGYGELYRESVFAELIAEARTKAAAENAEWNKRMQQDAIEVAELERKYPAEVWTNSAALAGAAPSVAEKTGRSVGDVLASWRADGPLVHEPTGFAELDELTGGGPVYGSRWYLNGQPDAGKTAFLMQLAHIFALRGVCLGLLAVDEEDGDLVTRFAQRVGHSRKNCEIRDPAVVDQIEAELAGLPIRFYDATWTIETAAADLAKFADGRRMMLGIDSLQTVSCDAERAAQRELSEMAAVTARVQAIRKAASQHKLIALCTSEMSRSAYRKADPSDLTSTMAASKHSGAVEYSARVLLGLRSVKDESDLIEVDIAKNKHGPSGRQVYLRVDRATQTLRDAVYEPAPEPDASERRLGRVSKDAERIAQLISDTPDMSTRQLHTKARAVLGLGKDAVDAAVDALGTRIVITEGARGAKLMRLCDRAG